MLFTHFGVHFIAIKNQIASDQRKKFVKNAKNRGGVVTVMMEFHFLKIQFLFALKIILY